MSSEMGFGKAQMDNWTLQSLKQNFIHSFHKSAYQDENNVKGLFKHQ